jgi:uncharacterized membrane protein YeaQ/YmgE (transglycosylase-associated protein family)
MSLLWTIIIGFIVGLVAKALMPGRDPGGFFITAALGIGGLWSQPSSAACSAFTTLMSLPASSAR